MRHEEHEPLAGKRAAVMIGPLFEDDEATYPYYRLAGGGGDRGADRDQRRGGPEGKEGGRADHRSGGRRPAFPTIWTCW